MSQHQFESSFDVSNCQEALERVEAKLIHLRAALDEDKAEWARVQHVIDQLKALDD